MIEVTQTEGKIIFSHDEELEMIQNDNYSFTIKLKENKNNEEI